MKLYIVDYRYHDVDENEDVSDRWTLACKGDSEVVKTMELNFEVLERYGYKPISYSYKAVSFTSNGYKISIN